MSEHVNLSEPLIPSKPDPAWEMAVVSDSFSPTHVAGAVLTHRRTHSIIY